jgi:hypothetical protein
MPKFAIPHSFLQCTKKGFPVEMITKDSFFPVPPAQDEGSGARILDSMFASHGTNSAHKKRGRKQYLTDLHTDPFLSGSGLGTDDCCSVTYQAIVKGSTPHRSRKTEFPVPGVAFLPEEKIVRSDLNIVNLLTQSISASEIPWP